MEIADGGFDAGKLVDVVYGVTGRGPCVHRLNVFSYRGDVRHAIEGVEGAAPVRCVKEKGVDVCILDVGGEGGF